MPKRKVFLLARWPFQLKCTRCKRGAALKVQQNRPRHVRLLIFLWIRAGKWTSLAQVLPGGDAARTAGKIIPLLLYSPSTGVMQVNTSTPWFFKWKITQIPRLN